MKTGFKVPIFLSLLVGLGYTNPVQAQTFRTLYQTASRRYSYAALVPSGDTLYGTFEHDFTLLGSSGAVYKIKTDGTGFAILHSFSGQDGATPFAGLLLLGNTLYGTTMFGGISDRGTIFRINPDGTGFRTLYSFTAGSGSPGVITNSDGAWPTTALVSSGGILYGTTLTGGASGNGTVFAIGIDGTGFTNLHSTASTPTGLTLSGTTLYGTAYGTLFALSTDGTSFTNVHLFGSTEGIPTGPPVLSGNTLYVGTRMGGEYYHGLIFAVGTDGTGFRIVHSFSPSEGASPSGALVLRDNTLYGSAPTTSPTAPPSIVFAVGTDGTHFTILHTFTNNLSEGSPTGGITLSGVTLYGAAFSTVFSISLDTKLAIASFNGNLLLAWPTSPSGYNLQFTTNLDSPVWTTISTPPAVLNGQNIVVSPISGPQQFYRLSSQ